jgi:hypothetical protein
MMSLRLPDDHEFPIFFGFCVGEQNLSRLIRRLVLIQNELRPCSARLPILKNESFSLLASVTGLNELPDRLIRLGQGRFIG